MIYLVGPFPPPMHGMGYVNDSVRKLIEKKIPVTKQFSRTYNYIYERKK